MDEQHRLREGTRFEEALLVAGSSRPTGVEFKSRLLYIGIPRKPILYMFHVVTLSITERMNPYGGRGTGTPVGIVEVPCLSYSGSTGDLIVDIRGRRGTQHVH